MQQRRCPCWRHKREEVRVVRRWDETEQCKLGHRDPVVPILEKKFLPKAVGPPERREKEGKKKKMLGGEPRRRKKKDRKRDSPSSRKADHLPQDDRRESARGGGTQKDNGASGRTRGDRAPILSVVFQRMDHCTLERSVEGQRVTRGYRELSARKHRGVGSRNGCAGKRGGLGSTVQIRAKTGELRDLGPGTKPDYQKDCPV